MLRPRSIVLAQVAALILIAGYFVHLRFRSPSFLRGGHNVLGTLEVAPNAILPSQNLTAYVRAILDPSDASLPKLECPRLDAARYAYLKPTKSRSTSTLPQYFFALNLRSCLPILPQLLGSILEAMRFLGPEHCALSIVEGHSPDGTAEVLAALQPQLTKLGIRTYFTLHNTIDPLAENTDRFSSLATLRNLALAPLLAAYNTSTTTTTSSSSTTPEDDDDTAPTILFINDVAACPDDLLELLHQRRLQRAHMACALDWTGADPPVFYDVYVARALNGDLYFDVPPDTVSWSRAADLFWNEPRARERLAARQPFQVFACWNGAVAFTARPLLRGEVVFRGADRERGECHAGEPQLFCKDLWWRGYGRVMVVPSVNLEYSVESGRAIKEAKGFASQRGPDERGEGGDGEAKIEWLPPPDRVKCMPSFTDQTWRAWNETLV